MRVAIVHDWLITWGGAERVLEELLLLYPEADLFTLMDFLPPARRSHLQGKIPFTTFCQKMPGMKKNYRNYLPLMPFAIENVDLSAYDLILSSSHCIAKGVLIGPGQLHICYCHSPMRYAWDLHSQYPLKGLKNILAKYFLHKMRLWDVRTSFGVDHFIANSVFIQGRIEKSYRRNAEVIYPPVDVKRFAFNKPKEDFYLTVSRLVSYKGIALLLEAFRHLPQRKLIVIGEGPMKKGWEKNKPPNVVFLGEAPDCVVQEYMEKARALVFAGIEDFGIALVEAQAAGTPVIALGKGGALEIVTPSTGIFFEPSVASLIEKIQHFETMQKPFLPEDCRTNAERFSRERFQNQFKTYVNKVVGGENSSSCRG